MTSFVGDSDLPVVWIAPILSPVFLVAGLLYIKREDAKNAWKALTGAKANTREWARTAAKAAEKRRLKEQREKERRMLPSTKDVLKYLCCSCFKAKSAAPDSAKVYLDAPGPGEEPVAKSGLAVVESTVTLDDSESDNEDDVAADAHDKVLKKQGANKATDERVMSLSSKLVYHIAFVCLVLSMLAVFSSGTYHPNRNPNLASLRRSRSPFASLALSFALASLTHRDHVLLRRDIRFQERVREAGKPGHVRGLHRGLRDQR
jgi:hypothetical protein